MISHPSQITSEYNTTRQTAFFWTDIKDTSVRDYSIPGMVVFRGFMLMFERFLTKPIFALLEKVFSSKGLQRHICSHMGLFYMVGKKQSCQASGSMVKPAHFGREHDYWNKATMNTTLLPMVQSVINTLGEEASQHQNSCGEMLLNLLRVLLSSIGVTLMTAQICIYNIFTYGFFNTPHRDNDGMWSRNSESIISLIKESGTHELVRWLEQFFLLFGTKTTLPMPTTYCWTLVEYLDEWDHHSISFFWT